MTTNEDEGWSENDAVLELMYEVAHHVFNNYNGYTDAEHVMAQHEKTLRAFCEEVVHPKEP
jgi:hypothetical protein